MNYLRKEFADKMNINNETLRYYENSGLLPCPERNKLGYRVYNEDSIKRIDFIKKAKACGLTLDEIKELSDILSPEPEVTDYTYISKLLNSKIDSISSRISELSSMLSLLKTIKTNIDNNVKCPIKSSFEKNS